MKKILYRYLGVISVSLFCAFVANAQIPKADSTNVNKDLVITIDENFEPQKSKLDGRSRRALAYEVWITTDGMLHCKTNFKLASALIEFTSLAAETFTASGAATLAKRGRPRTLNVALDPGPNGYLFDIRKDGYKEKQSITLNLTSVWNSGAVIKLVNKIVQPQMQPPAPNRPTAGRNAMSSQRVRIREAKTSPLNRANPQNLSSELKMNNVTTITKSKSDNDDHTSGMTATHPFGWRLQI